MHGWLEDALRDEGGARAAGVQSGQVEHELVGLGEHQPELAAVGAHQGCEHILAEREELVSGAARHVRVRHYHVAGGRKVAEALDRHPRLA